MITLLTGGHFCVSDLYAGHILKVAEDGSSEIVAELDDQPSGLGWMPDGSLLVVGMTKMNIPPHDPASSGSFSTRLGSKLVRCLAHIGSFNASVGAANNPRMLQFFKEDISGQYIVNYIRKFLLPIYSTSCYLRFEHKATLDNGTA